MNSHRVVYQSLVHSVGKTIKSIGELLIKRLYIHIVFYRLPHLLRAQKRIRLVLLWRKQVSPQRWESLPIALQTVYFSVRNTPKDCRINIVMFGLLIAIYIARNIQVVPILTYLITTDSAREALHRGTVAHGVSNLLDVTSPQFILFSIFHKALAGVYHQYIVILPMLL